MRPRLKGETIDCMLPIPEVQRRRGNLGNQKAGSTGNQGNRQLGNFPREGGAGNPDYTFSDLDR
ncbi:MAG TPA: hypothetical protein DD438_13480 [Verrucomicrobiales bacterium]|nr:hypothetical protein [Verrucomicrobiales bacterium]